jgi:hypothetical protein
LKKVEEAGLASPDSILNYVAKHTPPGMPPHSLTIKTNALVWSKMFEWWLLMWAAELSQFICCVGCLAFVEHMLTQKIF